MCMQSFMLVGQHQPPLPTAHTGWNLAEAANVVCFLKRKCILLLMSSTSVPLQLHREDVAVTFLIFSNVNVTVDHLCQELNVSSYHHIQGSNRPNVNAWFSLPVNRSCWGTRWLRSLWTTCRLWWSGTRPCFPPSDSVGGKKRRRGITRRTTSQREQKHEIRHSVWKAALQQWLPVWANSIGCNLIKWTSLAESCTSAEQSD